MVKHSELAAGVEGALTDKAFVSDVDTAQLTMCYPPIIQSGGNYQLEYSAGSDNNYLQCGTIVCSLGVRYKSYCSNFARTLLINSSLTVQQNYSFMQDIERELLVRLIPGAKLNEIYESVMAYARMLKPHLVDHLVKSFGFAIGIEFDDSSIIIGPSSATIVKANMVFNVSIGLDGLNDEDGKTCALLHSNTVIVKESCPATICTPPPYLTMIADCWSHVFDNLSIENVFKMSRTCKHMNQMVNDYFDKNLANYIGSVSTKYVGVIIKDDIFFTLFPKFNENTSIQEQLKYLVDDEPLSDSETISYFDIELNLKQFGSSTNYRVESIELNACVSNIFLVFPKLYPNLKNLAVDRCVCTSPLFLYHYKELEHLKFVPMHREESDQLKNFLERHKKLKHLDIELNFLWENRNSIEQTNIQLNRLTIIIADELQNKFPFNEFMNFLKRLHDRGFYKSLNFSLNCSMERKFSNEMPTIPALRKYPKYCGSNSASPLIDFKNLKIDIFSFEFRLKISEEKPTKLEHLSFCSAQIGVVSQFIRQSKTLKIVKLY